MAISWRYICRTFTFQAVLGTAWLSISQAKPEDAHAWGTFNLGLGRKLKRTSDTHPSNANAIGVGYGHNCAINSTGGLFCWGGNEQDQMSIAGTAYGNNVGSEFAFYPYPVDVSNGKQWTKVSSALAHSCGITIEKDALCWGNADYGALGSAMWLKDYPFPTLVDGGRKWNDISAGTSFTCGIDLDGYIYCWGYNQQGQLGINSKTDEFIGVPSRLSGNQTWLSISAGDQHTCAIEQAKMAYCWGNNDWSQLGNGGFGNASYVPSMVKGNLNWVVVDAGGYHSCGVAVDGNAYCWGSNESGELGDGTNRFASVPVLVKGNYQWVTISSGTQYSCGIIANGSAFCWGSNFYGQLGHGTFRNSWIPRKVVGPYAWVTLTIGKFRACGITEESKLFCWGYLYTGGGDSLADFTLTLPSQVRGNVTWGLAADDALSSSTQDSAGGLTGAQLGAIVAVIVCGVILAGLGTFLFVRYRQRRVSKGMQMKHVDGPVKSMATSGMVFHPVVRALKLGISTKDEDASTKNFFLHPDLKCIEFEEFDLGSSLGQGSFGHVHKGTWNRTSVAVKFLLDHHATWSSPDADLGKTLREEALLMAQLRHPNIVQFMGICRDPAAIVTEFCARRSLHAILAQARGSPAKAAELTWDRRLGLLADAARGMLYLHSNKPHAIVHGDVKSLNVVVTEQWVAKVCDFGFSRAITQHHSRDISSSHLPGNPRWLAPELLKEEGQPSTKSDVYAFAMVMWEVLVWQVPWESAQNIAIFDFVEEGHRPVIPAMEELPGPPGSADLLLRYVRLMEHCWHESPEERPPFEIIVSEIDECAKVSGW